MQGEEFKEHQAFKLMKWFHLPKSFCHVARGWNCSYLINLQHQTLYNSQNSLCFVLWLEKFIIAGSITDKSCLIFTNRFINHFEAFRQYSDTEWWIDEWVSKILLGNVWRLGTCDERRCIITKLNHSSPVQSKENKKEEEIDSVTLHWCNTGIKGY